MPNAKPAIGRRLKNALPRVTIHGARGIVPPEPLRHSADTAGPALNPMIKVVNLLALILAPALVMIENGGSLPLAVAAVIALIILFAMTIWSLRKSMRPAEFKREVSDITQQE